jgi:hypothetical protein
MSRRLEKIGDNSLKALSPLVISTSDFFDHLEEQKLQDGLDHNTLLENVFFILY